jgi:hypothetical protein
MMAFDEAMRRDVLSFKGVGDVEGKLEWSRGEIT